MVELADTWDLKSHEQKCSSQFESGWSYKHLIKIIMNTFKKIMQFTAFILLLVTAGFTLWNTYKIKNDYKCEYEEYSYAYDCVREAELKYHEIKSVLCDEVQNYITSIAPSSNLRGYAVVEECLHYGIDICFVLAQGEMESHYATKGIGRKLNNVFNVGVYDNLTYSEISKNYKYDYPNQSIRPYLELLTESYLVNKTEEDLLHDFVNTQGNRYASDINYERKLKEKIEYIKLSTNINELQDKLANYAVKCNR